jgi:hypothetical protein
VQRPWLPAPILLLAALLLACGGGGDSDEPEPTPTSEATPTPEAVDGPLGALQAYVEATLQKQFLADCGAAAIATDTGKICASDRGERESMRAYVIGQTFSEFSDWVIVAETTGSWSVVKTLPITADNISIPGIPWPLRTGVDLVVTGTGSSLNVREGPSLSQLAVDALADGSVIQLAEGPQVADGIEWWRVDGRDGWVAGDYLRYPDALDTPPVGQPPPPTPEPTATRGPVLP